MSEGFPRYTGGSTAEARGISQPLHNLLSKLAEPSLGRTLHRRHNPPHRGELKASPGSERLHASVAKADRTRQHQPKKHSLPCSLQESMTFVLVKHDTCSNQTPNAEPLLLGRGKPEGLSTVPGFLSG